MTLPVADDPRINKSVLIVRTFTCMLGARPRHRPPGGDNDTGGPNYVTQTGRYRTRLPR